MSTLVASLNAANSGRHGWKSWKLCQCRQQKLAQAGGPFVPPIFHWKRHGCGWLMTGGNDITKYALMIYIKLYLENIRNISYICKKTINQVGYSNGWADAVVFRPHSWVHLIACCWKNQICWVLWNKMERATFSQSCGCSIGILKGPENFFVT